MLFEPCALGPREIEVVGRIEALQHNLRYAVVQEPRRWTGQLSKFTQARAIQGSVSIEGYHVTLDDAVAVVNRNERGDHKDEARLVVQCYQDAMTYILQRAKDPHFTSYSSELLCSLHYMMMKYDLNKSPGQWRGGPAFVRNEATGEIVYEGPEAEQVPRLIQKLTDSLNSTDAGVPPLVRAAMGHLNLVMLHPFRDGNGRMARALHTLILAREGTLAPEFSSIESYLGRASQGGRNTREYYAVLASVGKARWNPHGKTEPWIQFVLKAHLHQATTLLRRLKEAARLWDSLESVVGRAGLPERSITSLFNASHGIRIQNAAYRSDADVSVDVAGRDLAMLVRAGFLIPHGAKRGRYYAASDTLKQMREEAREPKRVLENPFANLSLPIDED